MSTRLRKFIELPASERRLLGSAALAIVKARLSLTLMPIRQILKPVAVRKARDGNIDPARIGWAVETASRIVPTGRNCLVRAIAGRHLLARHGFPGRVRIGIGKNSPDRLMAHAWLECGELIITGAHEQDFAVLPLHLARSLAAGAEPRLGAD
jgi:hypothetical protein